MTGFITRGRGISVHKVGCRSLSDLEPERQIPVEWDATVASRHSGEIQVVCSDRPGLLANISKVCERASVNISRVEARNIGDDMAVCTLELAIRDAAELGRLIKSLEKVVGVESVRRVGF